MDLNEESGLSLCALNSLAPQWLRPVCSRVSGAWGSLHSWRSHCDQVQRTQALAKACGGGAAGWQPGLDLRKQEAAGWAEGTGLGEAGPWEESLGGPGQTSASRFGNPALQPWLHSVWGKPQNHVWPSGFHCAGNNPAPPYGLPVPVAGPVGRAAGGAEFSGGPLALGPRAGGGEQAPQALATTFLHLAAQQALGKQLFLGNWMGSASLISKALLATPVAKPGLSPTLLSKPPSTLQVSVFLPAGWEYLAPTQGVPSAGRVPHSPHPAWPQGRSGYHTTKPWRASGGQRHLHGEALFLLQGEPGIPRIPGLLCWEAAVMSMGRARGCPGGVFPGEGPRPSTWPGQACRPQVRPVDPQCSLLARPGICQALCPPGRSQSPWPWPWTQVSLSWDAGVSM